MAKHKMKMCCIFALLLICVLMTCFCCQSMKKKNTPTDHIDTSCGGKPVHENPLQPTGGAYVVYGYMSCPYTVKQVDYMDKNNISYTFVDTTSDAGSKALAAITGGGTGVPVIVNTKTDQFKVGFTEI